MISQEAGVVRSILCAPNAQVKAGEALIRLEPLTAEDLESQDALGGEGATQDAFMRRWAQLSALFISQDRSELSGREELRCAMRAALLGYDMSPCIKEAMLTQLRRELERLKQHGESEVLSPETLHDGLKCFAEVQVLFDRHLAQRGFSGERSLALLRGLSALEARARRSARQYPRWT